MRLRMLLLAALAVSALAQVVSAQQPAAPAALRSPEVLPDHRVTFRISAPTATAVTVV
jgi:hypothetical protein